MVAHNGRAVRRFIFDFDLKPAVPFERIVGFIFSLNFLSTVLEAKKELDNIYDHENINEV